MKIRYVGTADPTDDVECTVFGLIFTQGKWQDLAEVPAPLLANPVFEVAADEAGEAAVEAGDAKYGALKLPALKALAAERSVELNGATKKGDIIVALMAADEAMAPVVEEPPEEPVQ